jgi:hypothetical protein
MLAMVVVGLVAVASPIALVALRWQCKRRIIGRVAWLVLSVVFVVRLAATSQQTTAIVVEVLPWSSTCWCAGPCSGHLVEACLRAKLPTLVSALRIEHAEVAFAMWLQVLVQMTPKPRTR